MVSFCATQGCCQPYLAAAEFQCKHVTRPSSHPWLLRPQTTKTNSCLRPHFGPHKPINRCPQSPNRENRIWRQNFGTIIIRELQLGRFRPRIDNQSRWSVTPANPTCIRIAPKSNSLGKLCRSSCESRRGKMMDRLAKSSKAILGPG